MLMFQGWHVIIIQRLKSALIHRGESRADQRDFVEDRTENVKSCSSSNPEMSVFENTLMSSEEDLIKASVAKMVLEDDLTSAASRFCLYFCQSPFTCLSSPHRYPPTTTSTTTTVSSPPCLRCCLEALNINEAAPPMYWNTSERWLKMTRLSLTPFFCSPLFITGDCSLLDNIWEAWRMANYVP